MTKREKAYMEVLKSLGLSDSSLLEKERQESRLEGALEAIELLEKGYSLADVKKKMKLA